MASCSASATRLPAGLVSASTSFRELTANGGDPWPSRSSFPCCSAWVSSLSPNHLAGVSLRATLPHRYASNGFCFLVLVQDDHGKAQTEFNKIHSDLKNPTQQKVLQDEFLLLRAQVSQELKNRVPLLDFFRQKSLRKRCIIGWLTFFAGQGTATLVINSKGIPLACFSGL